MKSRSVVFRPEAQDDLIRLYDYIAERETPLRAITYIERIEAFCQRLDIASERGNRRDDVRAGLRTISFEKNCVIAFQVQAERVVIIRIFFGGQDWEAHLN